MTKDTNVQAAIAHWAPRFLASGVLLADFQEITDRIDEWEQWCTGWSVKAAEFEALGRTALDQGQKVSAAEHLVRASVYYHFAKFVFVQDQAQMRVAHFKAVECSTLALPFLRPPGERIEVPFESKKLIGVLRKPPGVDRPPVVLVIPGLDSTKEEMGNQEAVFLARGMATLALDGPGWPWMALDKVNRSTTFPSATTTRRP